MRMFQRGSRSIAIVLENHDVLEATVLLEIEDAVAKRPEDILHALHRHSGQGLSVVRRLNHHFVGADAVHLVEHAIRLAVEITLNAQRRKLVGYNAQVPSGKIAPSVFAGTVSHDLRRRLAFIARAKRTKVRALEDNAFTRKIAGTLGTVAGNNDPASGHGVFSQFRHRNILSHGEGILEEHHVCFLRRLKINAHHIKSEWRLAGDLAQKFPRHAGKIVALVIIHRRFRGKKFSRSAGLDLNEAERFAVPADDVQFAVAAGRAIVARNDYVSLPAQVEVSFFFAATAGFEVRSRGRASGQNSADGIKHANCRAGEPAGHAFLTLSRGCAAKLSSPPNTIGACERNPMTTKMRPRGFQINRSPGSPARAAFARDGVEITRSRAITRSYLFCSLSTIDKHSSSTSIAISACSRVTISGGAKRIEFAPAPRKRTPRSNAS